MKVYQAAGVANEWDGCHGFVLLDQGVVRVLDEDVQHGKVLLGITEDQNNKFIQAHFLL